jgi:hypothetical protein
MSGYGFEGTGDAPLAKIEDVVSATETYICEAKPSTSSAAPNWRCRKITTTGGVKVTTWAGGGEFSQIANNRAALLYT